MSGPGVPSIRASDADRDRVVRVLRDAAVDGRLAHESFVRRVDQALRARDQQALGELVADLPADRPVASGLLTGLSALTRRLEMMAPRYPALRLPDRRRPVLVIGRRPNCDVALSDRRVSRVHAVLMLLGDRWFLDDLRSTNGTRLNGFRIRGATPVRPGDRVSFAGPTFRLAAPA